MTKRKLLKGQDRRKLVDIPVDEDSSIRRYSLSLADRLEIELRRCKPNRLGFAIQLCLTRYPGRVLGAEEIPPRAMLKYVADQTGTAPDDLPSMHAVKKPVGIICAANGPSAYQKRDAARSVKRSEECGAHCLKQNVTDSVDAPDGMVKVRCPSSGDGWHGGSAWRLGRN